MVARAGPLLVSQGERRAIDRSQVGVPAREKCGDDPRGGEGERARVAGYARGRIDAWHMAAEVSVHPDFAGAEDDSLGFEFVPQRRGQFADF